MRNYKISVLLIEDDASLVFILTRFLENLNMKVESSYTAKEGLIKALTNKYQILIIDIGLPDSDGFKIIEQIRLIDNTKPIIVITGDNSRDKEIYSYKAKANIFHPKPIKFDILEAQIKSLIEDQYPNIIVIGDLCIDKIKRIVKIKNKGIKLTHSEYNLLIMLIDSNGEIFTRKQILSNIMNYYRNSSETSVDTLVCRIRKKLGNKIGGDLIKTVYKSGYCINPYLKDQTLRSYQ
ncbi:MAG: response regulator transcription factor [Candidatus Dojkabacteria bacterium]|nr:response regulator transcription factor [Candidatus Dojkabacteria bacterium]